MLNFVGDRLNTSFTSGNDTSREFALEAPPVPPTSATAHTTMHGSMMPLQDHILQQKQQQKEQVVAFPLLTGNATTATTTNATTATNDRVDQVTAQRIAELQAQKAAAVAVEDYDEAKRLKIAIERLKNAGAKMAALEERKRAAVEIEDYDAAKALKEELEGLRVRAYAAIQRGEHLLLSPGGVALHGGDTSNNNNNNNGVVVEYGKERKPEKNTSSDTNQESEINDGNESDELFSSPLPYSRHQGRVGGTAPPRPSHPSPPLQTTPYHETPTPSSVDWKMYDERPARAKGAYDLTAIETSNANTPPRECLPLFNSKAKESVGAYRLFPELILMVVVLLQ